MLNCPCWKMSAQTGPLALQKLLLFVEIHTQTCVNILRVGLLGALTSRSSFSTLPRCIANIVASEHEGTKKSRRWVPLKDYAGRCFCREEGHQKAQGELPSSKLLGRYKRGS